MEFTKLFIILLPLVFQEACSQSEGDVRLTGETPTDKYQGRLEIYWKGKWGTFCRINTQGADAACKQLGLSEVFMSASYRYRAALPFNVTRASDDTPIAIASTSCQTSVDHVLRCNYSSDVPSTCTHDDDMILFCLPTQKWLHPYDTEVRLRSSTYFSTGVLEMYANDQWGNICSNKFNQGAADSACRQMGFTGAKAFSSASNTSKTTWLSGVKCSQSCNCLNGCFGKTPSKAAHCSSNKFASITCTFDITKINSSTAGNYNDCLYRQGTCNEGSGREVGVIVGVVIVLLVVTAITICVVSLIAYFVISSRKRKGYHSIND